MKFLSEKGWQSDERFTECYIRSRIRAGFGPIRIALELTQKGVEEHVFEKHLKSNDEPFWMQQITCVFLKRFKQAAQNRAQYLKQCQFLQNRGFAQYRIIQVLKGDDYEYE